jgi:hypothetical protein
MRGLYGCASGVVPSVAPFQPLLLASAHQASLALVSWPRRVIQSTGRRLCGCCSPDDVYGKDGLEFNERRSPWH